jgi:hypothetical protein
MPFLIAFLICFAAFSGKIGLTDICEAISNPAGVASRGIIRSRR